MSEDPIGFAGGAVNLIRYVGNSPAIWIDPTGLFSPFWNAPVRPKTRVAAIADKGEQWQDWVGLAVLHQYDEMFTTSGPENLADQLEEFPDQSIKELVLSGHGSGDGGIQASESDINSRMDPKVADRIKEKLHPDCIVTIAGCRTGLHPEGIQDLADLLGVRVRGSVSDLSPGEMPATYVEAQPGGGPPYPWTNPRNKPIKPKLNVKK